jgi:uncharacterized protein YlxW (UPF0749 family)
VGAEDRGRSTAGAPDSPATVGLIPYLSRHALDDDYRTVAARQAPADGPPRRGGGGWTVVVLAAFVLLLMTAATQTSRNAVADEDERKDLITQIRQGKEAVQADTTRIDRLQAEVAELRTGLLDSDKLSAGTRDQLQLLSVRAGVAPVRGPGVVVTVDDAPGAESDRSTVLDSDLQQLVNGLWQAGAEAISINGQRLTNLSAIRQAGSAISVNFDRLDRPYVVQAIGDPAALPRRFGDTASGQTWLDLQQRVGLQFSMRTRTKLSLPGAGVPTLRQARLLRTGNQVKEATP